MLEKLAAMPDYARYFKQQLVSDCDLIITWSAEVAVDSWAAEEQPSCTAAETEPTAAHVIEGLSTQDLYRSCSFPAHQLVLFNSKHFEAQGQRWQATSTSSSSDNQQQTKAATAEKPRISINLSLDSKEQLPAAEAVIAALYGVEGWFHDLQHEQLLQALVIADMIDLPELAEQLFNMLKTAAESDKGLTTAALRSLADLYAWPYCLHQLLPAALSRAATWPTTTTGTTSTPVPHLIAVAAADKDNSVQRIVLAAYGDLQAVWQNAALLETLMQLPLPAMQLLLGSDKLQVPSEDIVLYTAQQYIEKQQGPEAQDAASAALLSLVRAPLLSDLALHLAALPDTSHMRKHESMFAMQLRSLISLQRITQGEGRQPNSVDLGKMTGAPLSWMLSPRQLIQEQPAVVVWRLPIQQLKTACMRAARAKTAEYINSPRSPPLGGLAWQMGIECRPEEGGVKVGLFAGPFATRKGIFHQFKASVDCSNWDHTEFVSDCLDGCGLSTWGWPDYFNMCPMAGGWNAAAWAAKGLPTSGDLVLELKVLDAW